VRVGSFFEGVGLYVRVGARVLEEVGFGGVEGGVEGGGGGWVCDGTRVGCTDGMAKEGGPVLDEVGVGRLEQVSDGEGSWSSRLVTVGEGDGDGSTPGAMTRMFSLRLISLGCSIPVMFTSYAPSVALFVKSNDWFPDEEQEKTPLYTKPVGGPCLAVRITSVGSLDGTVIANENLGCRYKFSVTEGWPYLLHKMNLRLAKHCPS